MQPTNGHHLWSEQYNRDIEDLFALQDEITHKILVALPKIWQEVKTYPTSNYIPN